MRRRRQSSRRRLGTKGSVCNPLLVAIAVHDLKQLVLKQAPAACPVKAAGGDQEGAARLAAAEERLETCLEAISGTRKQFERHFGEGEGE